MALLWKHGLILFFCWNHLLAEDKGSVTSKESEALNYTDSAVGEGSNDTFPTFKSHPQKGLNLFEIENIFRDNATEDGYEDSINAQHFLDQEDQIPSSTKADNGYTAKGSPRHGKIMSQGVGLVPDEQLLMERLMVGYHKYSRPVVNASYTVMVKFGLTLVQISDMDEVNQVLTINVWLEQEWVDERLTWNPEDYNNLTILRIPCEKLWLPDIVLYNSADDYTTGYMNSKAMVHHSGNVFWPPPAKFRSSCKIDITYFPFDDQVCELKFGSWTYDGFQVDITNRSSTVDLANYVFSGEWELIDVRIKRMEIYYACCHEPYPDVRFTIVIRRKTLYYLFNIIFPCLWLTILSLLGFWLPPDSGEKITLGITVLLAFSVFMLLIAESMPATSEFVPLIGIYLTVTMGMTSLSIILTVFVLQLYHVGPHKRPVPGWLRTLVFGVFARLVCMSRQSQPFIKHHQFQSKLKPYNSDAVARGRRPGRRDVARQTKQKNPKVVVEPSPEPVTVVFSDTCEDRYTTDTVDVGHAAEASNKEGINHGLIVESSDHIKKGNDSNCNGGATQVQRDTVINCPINSNELTPPSASCMGTTVQGLQCREYNFHHTSSTHQEQLGGIYRTPSFRSRSSSFRSRGDSCSYRGSFRAGFPVDASNHDGCINSSFAAGGGAMFPGGYIGPGAFSDQTFDSYQQLVLEWQFVAHVMDRLLFWLFLFVALVSSVAILVIKPMFKPPPE